MTVEHPLRRVFICLPALCTIAGLCAAADHWPRFRGPNGSAAAADPKAAETIPVTWTDADYNWKIKLPGGGYSSPVIWGERIFVTCANEQTALRTVCCISAKDGSVLWQREYEGQKHRVHRDNHLASSSPAADAERVYAYWAEPNAVTVLALTHDGKDVWRRDLGPYASIFGGGTSPIVYRDMVIINNDQKGDSALIALDAKTGKDRWRTPRKTAKVPYAAPLVYTGPGEKPQLIFVSTLLGLSGVDPDTGKVLWGLGGPLDAEIRAVGSAVVAGDLVLATWGQRGRGRVGLAVRPGSADGKRPPKIVYKLTAPMHYSTTPVVAGKRIFACTDHGEMQCLDASTGKKLWAHSAAGGFYGSPVLVGGRVYFTTKKGVVVIVAAADEFKLLGKVPLGEKTYATPAIVGGVMYIRTFNQLMSLGGKSK